MTDPRQVWSDPRIYGPTQTTGKERLKSTGCGELFGLMFALLLLSGLALGYVGPLIAEVSVPNGLVVAGLWALYVLTGTTLRIVFVAFAGALSSGKGTISAARRRFSVLAGMLLCALVTWGMETLFRGLTGFARAILYAPGELGSAAVGVAVVQAPGAVALACVLALGFGPTYRGVTGLAKATLLASVLTAASLAVLLVVGSARAA